MNKSAMTRYIAEERALRAKISRQTALLRQVFTMLHGVAGAGELLNRISDELEAP